MLKTHTHIHTHVRWHTSFGGEVHFNSFHTQSYEEISVLHTLFIFQCIAIQAIYIVSILASMCVFVCVYTYRNRKSIQVSQIHTQYCCPSGAKPHLNLGG